MHVGAMSWAAKALASAFPDPSPDDVYLLNDPYRGGSHLPDLTIFVPVFADEAADCFWSVVRAHHSDIGGATHGAYNPAATEIWHEGLRIPPMRLTENGVLREDLLEMLALNVRHPARLPRRPGRADRRRPAGRAAPGRGHREFGADDPGGGDRGDAGRRRAPCPLDRRRLGRTASMTARRCWTMTASQDRHRHPRARHQAGQRRDGRPDRTPTRR